MPLIVMARTGRCTLLPIFFHHAGEFLRCLEELECGDVNDYWFNMVKANVGDSTR